MSYIFISGIHGVGKTTLTNRLKEVMDIDAYSVSDLIRKSGSELSKINKKTQNIEGNQNLWKKELRKIPVSNTFIFLDGHFSLLDKYGNIVEIPFSTFEDTDMKKIILLVQFPKVLKERIEKRDGSYMNIEKITQFQNSEICRAKIYSAQKNIPLFIFDNTKSFDELIRFIQNS